MFKKGDQIRILPSATDMGVSTTAIGTTGVITDCKYLGQYFIVYMDDKCKIRNCRRTWAVKRHQITPVIKVGQQLLLWEE